MQTIHPSALVDPSARLGDGVTIGPFTIIHANVEIGANTTIGSHCEIGIPTKLGDGSPLIIGADSTIRSHSLFYESSRLGAHLVTGHAVMVREGTKAGERFQLGTQSEIQGDCEIGHDVRFQSNIFVGKESKIGNCVWLFPYVTLTNDPTPPSNIVQGCVIEDFAAIAAKATLLPGVHIGRHALVAAGACVSKDVPEGMAVAGVPARILCAAKDIKLRDGSGQAAYPWPLHFTRGYPEEVLAEGRR